MTEEQEKGFDVIRYIDEHEWTIGLMSEAVIFVAENIVQREEKNVENLRLAAKHVKQGKGSVLVVANHLSMFDALPMRRVRRKFSNKTGFAVFWANKFTGKDDGLYQGTQEHHRKISIAGKVGTEAARRSHIELISIPQEATRENAYLAREILENTRTRLIENPGVVGLFPEGTRSRDGSLQQAKEGAVNKMLNTEIARNNTLILPMAITGSDEILVPDTEKFNIKGNLIIRYGKPFTYAEAKKEMDLYCLTLADVVMLHIARMLPEEKWGYYSEKFKAIIANEPSLTSA